MSKTELPTKPSQGDLRSVYEREMRRRQRIARAIEQKWADPEHRARMIEGLKRGWEKRRARMEQEREEVEE